MRRSAVWIFVAGAAALTALQQPAAISIDYPQDGSIFPPEITAPTFLWRDPAPDAKRWRIDISFADGSPGIHAESRGERLKIGEIDPRCVSATNELPKLSPQQAASWAWTPEEATWAAIKKRSVKRAATVTISGFRDQDQRRPVSAGRIRIQTSADPVGAPIFYRDVPLMPSELEKGVIKPLDASAVPLIAWRLRNVGEPASRLLMEGLHTCANCHSFSLDGKTLGMDLDGPRNDKGMYTLVSLAPRTVIRDEDVIRWSSFRGRLFGDLRVAFLSQVSPDGKYVVTTIEGLGIERGRGQARKTNLNNYYVANFKDYRFLQVFYPTRGILAWYSREKGVLQPLPGADDPQYVHADAVWSPDGKYLVFARARATDPYPAGQKMAEFANDPNETQIRYDLYRIPFNDGKGGRAEPIPGGSGNGMSNTFPKISPDGRWIVFVQCRNGQLMRPDGQLYIVPASGGQARRMRCNTPLMNSWHSFSPNGRWLVFSSKSRSPYTQMYLTHLDENGQDSPAILIDNATAANRAVNIPEFVNIPPDGLLKIDAPAVEYYKLYNQAWELGQKGRHQEAVVEWRKALALSPEDYGGNMNLGLSLAATGKLDEAMVCFRKALDANPESVEGYNNLGLVLAQQGKLDQAIGHYRKALEIDPEYLEACNNLGLALAATGKLDEAIAQYRKALEVKPDYADVHLNLGVALARTGHIEEAIAHFEKAAALDPESAEAQNDLGIAMAGQGKLEEAIARYRKALEISPGYPEAHNNLGLALAATGKLDEAIAHFRKALEIQSAYPAARNNLGMALARTGRLDEAITEYQRALELNPRYLEAHSNLAAAYAEAGRFPEAAEAARRALALVTREEERPLAEALKNRIALYESRASNRTRP
jgi:tetratricopeptide (TPR) repeat protein